MSPFQGQGGNTAMIDALALAEPKFHATSRFEILSRNLGFRVGNAVINSRLTRRKAATVETTAR
jgi:hypothetical protein